MRSRNPKVSFAVKCLCAVLALLTVLPAVSCATTAENATDAAVAVSTEAVSEEDTANPDLRCDLDDDIYFGGDEQIILLYLEKDGVRDEFDKTEASSAMVDNAVYERNVAVETRLGIRFRFVANTNIASVHEKDVKSGYKRGESYDIVTNSTHLEIAPVTDGYFTNLTPLENIDTAKHYWTQGYNDLFTYGEEKKQYLANGAISLSLFRYMFITLYNKDLFVDNGIDDLYPIIKNGEWTLDKQYEILKERYVDLDGDHKKSQGDFYGFVTGSCVSQDPYTTACDIHMIVKEEDTGNWIFDDKTIERFVDMADKLTPIFKEESTYMWSDSDDDVGRNSIVMMFAQGHSLMATALVFSMESCIGEIGFNYGVAPIPKLSKDQKNYGTYVQDQVTSVGISSSLPKNRLETIAAVMEYMCYKSYDTVRDAYYVKALSLRFMNDPESSEIIGLIYDSLIFDFVGACSGILNTGLRGNIRIALSTCTTKASTFKAYGKSVTSDLKKLNNRIEKMKH